MIIPENIGQQEEIRKIEISSFYANKRIIGISTIIQELANNYLNESAIWKERLTKRALKAGFISPELLTRYCKLIRYKYLDHLCIKCNGEDNVIPDVHLEEKRLTLRAIKAEFISPELLTRYCKLIGHKYPDHLCIKSNGEDNVIPDV
ncbi:hypothetical protein H5410_050443 [Solanum commersonii]|uniref:Uncharacterized protein n=1 Tax=Solanum commersonii TaxID=4109 RepID=A0A9J5WXW1_SOLCO|nr:hypothetical protein H5410_050443 [Solanum commersonii]